MDSYYPPELVEELRQKCSTILGRYQRLMASFLSVNYGNTKAREYATHGFVRRLGTLARCIEKVFEILPPECTGLPSRSQLLDAAIYVQAFIFNVFGSFDNLAWIWVYETNVTKYDGSPLPISWVGLGNNNDCVRASLSAESRAYLESLHDWFDYLEDFRHALAHRIPLYIPPYIVSPTNLAAFQELGERMSTAIVRGDYTEYDRLSEEQDALGLFRPWIRHSFTEDTKPVVLHAQILADFETVEAIAERILAELRARP